MNGIVHCPSCDAANPADASFCQTCGRPMGAFAAAAPAGTFTTTTAGGLSGTSSAMIAAITVAVVLVAGGTLFFVSGGNDGDKADTTPGSSGAVSSTMVAPTTVVPTTVVPTTVVPTTVVPTTVAPTTVAPTTVAPPPLVPPPSTAAPVPTAAPVLTAAPGVGAITFDQSVGFYRSYVATAIGGDYINAWNMLSERDQRDYDRGFDQFVEFWQSVSFAEVEQIDSLGGGPSLQSMRVDMAYGQVDGGPTSFEVIEVDVTVRPDGLLQIFDYRFIGTQ